MIILTTLRCSRRIQTAC